VGAGAAAALCALWRATTSARGRSSDPFAALVQATQNLRKKYKRIFNYNRASYYGVCPREQKDNYLQSIKDVNKFEAERLSPEKGH